MAVIGLGRICYVTGGTELTGGDDTADGSIACATTGDVCLESVMNVRCAVRLRAASPLAALRRTETKVERR